MARKSYEELLKEESHLDNLIKSESSRVKKIKESQDLFSKIQEKKKKLKSLKKINDSPINDIKAEIKKHSPKIKNFLGNIVDKAVEIDKQSKKKGFDPFSPLNFQDKKYNKKGKRKNKW